MQTQIAQNGFQNISFLTETKILLTNSPPLEPLGRLYVVLIPFFWVPSKVIQGPWDYFMSMNLWFHLAPVPFMILPSGLHSMAWPLTHPVDVCPRSVILPTNAVSQSIVSWPPIEYSPCSLPKSPLIHSGCSVNMKPQTELEFMDMVSSKGISSMCILFWEPHWLFSWGWLWKKTLNSPHFGRPKTSFRGN